LPLALLVKRVIIKLREKINPHPLFPKVEQNR
jgi:hypothetical protein